MSQLSVSGAVIAGWYTRVKNGQKEIEIDIRADWSDKAREVLGVETPSDGYGKSEIATRLNGVNFILTPSAKELQSYEIDLSCSTVNKFRYVPVLDKEGHVRSRELHFTIHSGMTDGSAKLENYAGHVGDSAGRLTLVYNEQAQIDLSSGESGEPNAEPPKRRGRKKAEAEMVQ